MREALGRLTTLVVAAAIVATAAGVAAQTTTTETRKFTVVSVNGNTLVARDQTGTSEYTVPDDFRFNVGGKQIGVRELKPGMTGTAVITTTTTVKPVYVTEIKEGTVVQNNGSSIIVRTPEGFKTFTEADLTKRNIKITKNGKPAELKDLRAGNKLTATVVTEGEPQVLTQRQVEATVSAADLAASGAAAGGTVAAATRPAGSSGAAAAAGSGASAGRSAAAGGSGAAAAAGGGAAGGGTATLPKTASNVPLLGAVGIASLALALALTVRRRYAHR